MNNISLNSICFPNLTIQEVLSLRRSETASMFWIYQIAYLYVGLPVAVIAFLLTLLYAFSIKKAISCRRVSRKCYVFILNKAIGDIICCIFFISCGIDVLTSTSATFDINLFVVLATLCGSCFWSGMVSYVSLCILKLYAIWRPFSYRTAFSLRRCYIIIAFSWVFFLLISGFLWTMFAIKRVNLLDTLLQMRISTTMYLISRSQDIILIFLFLLTIVVFLLTVIIIQKGRSFIDSFQIRDHCNHRKRRRFPFWKISLGLVTYVILNVPYFLLSLKNLFVFDQCFWHVDRERKLILVAAFRGFLLFRILLDAFVGYIIDSQIRKCTQSILLGSSISTMKGGDSASNGPSFDTNEKQRTVSKSIISLSSKPTS